MSKQKKFQIMKIIVTILVLAVFIAITVYLFPIIKRLSTTEGQIEFKEQIKTTGWYGFLILFGLQVAQILLVVLPGEPLEVLAGMCYGTTFGTIFVLFSTLVTTTIIYYFVKKYGKKLLYQFFKKEKIDKIEESKIFKNQKYIERIFIILFLITGTPKDLLTYIGALLPIKPLRFILIATFCRLPSIISSTIAGSNITDGNWKISIVVYLITFAITALAMFIYDKIDKNKITKEALKVLKD